MESEKITKFFSFERGTTSIASRMAYNSALKMLDAALVMLAMVDPKE